MKVLSALLVTVCFATIVSAAPSSSNPTLPYQDFFLSKIIADFENNLKHELVDLECVHEVITKVIGESKIKATWDETSSTLEQLMKYDWPKCLEIEDFTEQQGCKTTVVGKGVRAAAKFVRELAEQSEWELIKEIKEKITAECYEKATFFDAEDQVEDKSTPAPSSSNPTLPYQEYFLSKIIADFENNLKHELVGLECVHKVITKVIGEGEIKGTWDETSSTLEQLMNYDWPKCLEIEDFTEQQGCKTTVVGKGVRAAARFIRALAEQSEWELMKEIKEKITAECYEKATFFDVEYQDEDESTPEPNFLKKVFEKVKCTIDAITEALKGSDYAPVWEEYKQELEKLIVRVKACKNEPSHVNVAKCVAKEAKQGHAILGKFFANLHNANKETYDRVKKTISEKCFQ